MQFAYCQATTEQRPFFRFWTGRFIAQGDAQTWYLYVFVGYYSTHLTIVIITINPNDSGYHLERAKNWQQSSWNAHLKAVKPVSLKHPKNDFEKRGVICKVIWMITRDSKINRCNPACFLEPLESPGAEKGSGRWESPAANDHTASWCRRRCQREGSCSSDVLWFWSHKGFIIDHSIWSSSKNSSIDHR